MKRSKFLNSLKAIEKTSGVSQQLLILILGGFLRLTSNSTVAMKSRRKPLWRQRKKNEKSPKSKAVQLIKQRVTTRKYKDGAIGTFTRIARATETILDLRWTYVGGEVCLDDRIPRNRPEGFFPWACKKYPPKTYPYASGWIPIRRDLLYSDTSWVEFAKKHFDVISVSFSSKMVKILCLAVYSPNFSLRAKSTQ